jgi:hypothetical protein
MKSTLFCRGCFHTKKIYIKLEKAQCIKKKRICFFGLFLFHFAKRSLGTWEGPESKAKEKTPEIINQAFSSQNIIVRLKDFVGKPRRLIK